MTRIKNAFGFLAGAWRIRPRSKRALSAISVILALSGAGMLTYPFATDFYSSVQQDALSAEFTSPEFKSRFEAGGIEPGQPLTRIRIPRIGLDALVVEGTDPKALRAGAGHYLRTSYPCDYGNVGIAGHRTTYGKPFNRIDELRTGDLIELITPEKKCTYKVVDAGPQRAERPHRGAPSWVTHPQDGGVIGALEGSFLTLTTCHPKGSAAKRLILRAELVGVSGAPQR